MSAGNKVEDTDLLIRFRRFFVELLPLFKLEGEANTAAAKDELGEARSMHTVLYFLKTEESRALIVNIKKQVDGSKRFYLHLNVRDVGPVQEGFTLIKKSSFDLGERFRKSFHALSLEPLLETKIDVLLFDELVESLKPGAADEESSVVSPIKDDMSVSSKDLRSSSKNEETEAYISIQDHTIDDHGVPLVKAERNNKIRYAAAKKISANLPDSFKEDAQKRPTSKRQVSGDSYGDHSMPLSDVPIRKEKPSDKSNRPPIESVRSSIQSLGMHDSEFIGKPILERRATDLNQIPQKSITKNRSTLALKQQKDESTITSLSRDFNAKTSTGNRSSSCKRSRPATDENLSTTLHTKQKSSAELLAKDRSDSEIESPSSPTSKQKAKQRKQIYVLDSLAEARRGVRMSKDRVNEIFYQDTPVSRASELVMQAVCLILTGKKLSWPKLKLEMRKPTWLKDILELEAAKVQEDVVQSVMRDYLMKEDWDASGAKQKSAPTKAFAEWVETFCWEHIKTKNGL